jgi:quinohemoprotein ethanol dehydrogenase
MIAAPMTYRVNGEQYLAITAGTGGGGWNFWFPENIAFTNGNANRILAFKLGGGATPKPEPLPPVAPLPEPPAQVGTAADIAAGAKLFAANCGSCHGNAPRSPVPDLRRSGVVRDGAAFQQVVRGGSLTARGMPAWDDLLTEAEVTQIHAYVVSTAREGYAAEQKASAKPAASQREGTSQGHL